jgi:hypothetical protein
MGNGSIELPAGVALNPGDTIEIEMSFLPFPQLDAALVPGRGWLIQEGALVVGKGTVLKVLGP